MIMPITTQDHNIQQNRKRIEAIIKEKKATYSTEERKAALDRLCGALAGLSLDNVYDIRGERLSRQ